MRELRKRTVIKPEHGILRVLAHRDGNIYLGFELHSSDRKQCLVYLDNGECDWFTISELRNVHRTVESAYSNTKISEERRHFNFLQMKCLEEVLGVSNPPAYLNPAKLSIGQVLWLNNTDDVNDKLVVCGLTQVAINVRSRRPEFNNVWLPFFSINFVHNRKQIQTISEFKFRDFTPVPPIPCLTFCPKMKKPDFHRSLLESFDARSHLLRMDDFEKAHTQLNLDIKDGQSTKRSARNNGELRLAKKLIKVSLED